MSAKWLFRAAVRWCVNGCWRYKSLVFRFDFRCFQIQTTSFPTKIQGFTHSIHHFPNTITSVSEHEFPVFLHCSIVQKPYFPTFQPHSDTSRHNSLIFKHEFHHFHTPLHSFHDAITSVFDTNFLFYVLGYKVLRTQSTTFKPNFTTFHIPFPHFTTQFPHFQTIISTLPHTIHSFSNTIPQLHDTIPSFSNQNFGKSTHKSTVPQLGYAAFKPRLLDFTCFSGGCNIYLR